MTECQDKPNYGIYYSSVHFYFLISIRSFRDIFYYAVSYAAYALSFGVLRRTSNTSVENSNKVFVMIWVNKKQPG